MNVSRQILWLPAWTLVVFGLTAVSAAENKPTGPQPTPRSVFVQPASVKDGRDPFFPESTRARAEAATPAAAARTLDTTSLKVHGISGTSEHLLAIINNHTFAEGDEGDVMTASGRLHIRCVEIRPDSVTVQVGGHTQRLNLESQK
jgi:hypothetical protein